MSIAKKKKKKFWSDKTILIIYLKWVQKGAQFKWRHISDSKKSGMSTTWGMMASSSGMWKNCWRLWWNGIFFFFEDANLTQSPIQLYLSAIQFVTCRGSPSGGILLVWSNQTPLLSRGALRWASNQRGASEPPRNLWCGFFWSKRSWVTTGWLLTSFAWEPAACWPTSRDRWAARDDRQWEVNQTIGVIVGLTVSSLLQIYHHVTGQYAAYHELPMAWSSLWWCSKSPAPPQSNKTWFSHFFLSV